MCVEAAHGHGPLSLPPGEEVGAVVDGEDECDSGAALRLADGGEARRVEVDACRSEQLPECEEVAPPLAAPGVVLAPLAVARNCRVGRAVGAGERGRLARAEGVELKLAEMMHHK